jgi:hypothetical protein
MAAPQRANPGLRCRRTIWRRRILANSFAIDVWLAQRSEDILTRPRRLRIRANERKELPDNRVSFDWGSSFRANQPFFDPG